MIGNSCGAVCQSNNVCSCSQAWNSCQLRYRISDSVLSKVIICGNRDRMSYGGDYGYEGVPRASQSPTVLSMVSWRRACLVLKGRCQHLAFILHPCATGGIHRQLCPQSFQWSWRSEQSICVGEYCLENRFLYSIFLYEATHLSLGTSCSTT